VSKSTETEEPAANDDAMHRTVDDASWRYFYTIDISMHRDAKVRRSAGRFPASIPLR
jgi:hypothetical protein